MLPVVDSVRTYGISYKRLTFRGHDGSLHPFAVQYPAARHCRREERIAQLFRMFNEYNHIFSGLTLKGFGLEEGEQEEEFIL
jgi:hypothetical protein